MAERQELDHRALAIEEAVRKLESTADASLRATTRELVHALMELHRAGLERALALIDQAGEPGAALIERLADDEIVKHLLVLHGLHPLDLQARVHQAVDRARPGLQSQGGDVDDIAVGEAGTVRVTLRVDSGSVHGCGSPVAALRRAVEEAIYEAAPDLISLTVEVNAESAVPLSFVPIEQVRRRHPDGVAASSDSERSAVQP